MLVFLYTCVSRSICSLWLSLCVGMYFSTCAFRLSCWYPCISVCLVCYCVWVSYRYNLNAHVCIHIIVHVYVCMHTVRARHVEAYSRTIPLHCSSYFMEGSLYSPPGLKHSSFLDPFFFFFFFSSVSVTVTISILGEIRVCYLILPGHRTSLRSVKAGTQADPWTETMEKSCFLVQTGSCLASILM